MSFRKQRFTDIYDNLSKVIDVDDSRGRSVPKNMNFIEEGFLSKDTGSEYFGDTDASEDIHSIFNYKKKDGTEYRLRVKNYKMQQYNSSTGVFDDIDRSIGAVTFTVANPTVATSTAHNLAAGDTVYFTTTGTLPTGISEDTPYYVIATGLTANDFQFSDTVGGTGIEVTAGGSGTHTVNKGWRPGAKFGYKVYDDELYGGNAVDHYFKWDGTTFTDYSSAPKGNILEIFEDRMFIAGVSDEPLTIYYSGTGTPTTFGGSDLLKPLGTDSVTNLVNYFGTLIIFKEDSIWKLTFIYDQVVSLFVPKLEVQSGNYGACSRKAVVWVENDIWFFTGREVRSIGYQDQQIGILGINNSVISENIKETLKTLPSSRFDQVAVFYNNRRFYLSVALSSATNDTTFVCHTLHGNNWTKYTDRIKSANQDYMEIDDEVYSASSVTPYGIVKWDDSSLNDNSVGFACEVFFDRIEDEDFNKFTFYRYLDLMFKDLDGRVTVTVKVDANDRRSEDTKTFIVGSTPINELLALAEVPIGFNMFGDSYGFTQESSPFQKKRVSFLKKGQGITIGLSNSNASETFTLAQMAISGHRKPRKMFKPENIVSV